MSNGHGFEDYFAAKAGLFRRVLPEDGTAVINIDDPRGPEMRAIAAARGQNVLTSERMVVDLEGGTAQMEGRVRTVIRSQDETGQGQN